MNHDFTSRCLCDIITCPGEAEWCSDPASVCTFYTSLHVYIFPSAPASERPMPRLLLRLLLLLLLLGPALLFSGYATV